MKLVHGFTLVLAGSVSLFSGCAGVAVQQFEADWKVGVDQEVKNVCANEGEGLSECEELNARLYLATHKACAKDNSAACRQWKKDTAGEDGGFRGGIKEHCAEVAPTACMLGREYALSGYSDAWLERQIGLGGRRAEVATRVKNRKAAERLRAETRDNQNASAALLIGLTAAAAGAAAATPVYSPAPVVPYYNQSIHCTSSKIYETTHTNCY